MSKRLKLKGVMAAYLLCRFKHFFMLRLRVLSPSLAKNNYMHCINQATAK